MAKCKCRYKGIAYREIIELQEKRSQASEFLYLMVASMDKKASTTVPKYTLSNMYNSVTRGLFVYLDRVIQRLCCLDGILSVRQIDILRSIRTPVVSPDKSEELN